MHTELADCVALLGHSSHDEVYCLVGQLLYALLDHVVAVLVIDTLKHGLL